MASSGDVKAVLESVQAEQQPAEACGGGESGLPATTTTTEQSQTMLQAVPAPASEQEAAAEVSASGSEERPRRPEQQKAAPPVATKEAAAAAADDDQAAAESTRERLKRHRQEMAGRVWVPELWGQEKLLKDWVDCAVFDRPMVPAGLLTARRALIAECCVTRRTDRTTSPASSAGSSPPLRVRNGCS
ncbi:unnamed protein product [Urochloa decumbens]|uniref:Uncharacterized protein n=1 Tax=Urochloa decumbens TaxID=240449 RepID=A0ABC9CXU3_9POAL